MAGPLPISLLPDTAEVSDDGVLSVGGLSLTDLAQEFGTPLFVYDETHLRNRCQEAATAWGEGVAYASKAFLCKAMAALVHEEGLMIDVATGGELFVVLAAGVPANRIILHGNNKSSSELEAALDAGVSAVVIDSFDEIKRIENLVESGKPSPDVLIRITPGVSAETHEFVQTGQDDSKFGFTVASGAATRAVELTSDSPHMNLIGIHAHIGSQVFRQESFREAAEILAKFITPLGLQELSVGGGLGVAYVEGEQAPSISQWAQEVIAGCRSQGYAGRISAEPGRSIVATAGITLYTIGTIKDLPGIREYVAVDGGMSDNPRPVLYGSGYETFLPRAVSAERPRTVRVVGKHCESGDLLVAEAAIPEDTEVGDVLATPVTGAYGQSMGSNYNKVLRPAVVFVSDGNARLVVRRETFEDLIRTDQ